MLFKNYFDFLECDKNCAGNCSGPGADACDACKYVQDGPNCVEECPDNKYNNENGVCKLCHEDCKDTCNGPGNKIGSDGCNSCKYFQDELSCVKECPARKYNENGVCKSCHENCLEGCTGPGSELCIACNYGSYKDIDGECKECHENCLGGCTGPNNTVGSFGGCNACKDKTYDESVCVKECPVTSYGLHSLCFSCNENCAEGCSGPGADQCDDCKHVKDEFTCVERCPDNKLIENGECIGEECLNVQSY